MGMGMRMLVVMLLRQEFQQEVPQHQELSFLPKDYIYEPYYGHVGLVVDGWWADIVTKHMNYRRLNEVTIRLYTKEQCIDSDDISIPD